MDMDQIAIVTILSATVAMFVWGKWRHDMVAMAALLACVATGLIPAAEAFRGFGHPAVITVACILILSDSLQRTGAVDVMTRSLLPRSAGPAVMIPALTVLAAVLSAFMNNIGALALLMPIALQIASRTSLPPGKILMPLAFGSILGGMTTLIGTPPNLIVSGYRAAQAGSGFGMFDFAPVGVAVAAAGIAFVLAFARWLVPSRVPAEGREFEIEAYLTEAQVPAESKAAGMRLGEIETALDAADAQVVGLIRDDSRIPAPSPARKVRGGDILVIEAEPEGLVSALSELGLKLEEAVEAQPVPEALKKATFTDGTDRRSAKRSGTGEKIQSDEIVLAELVVLPNAGLAGRSASDIRLRSRYGVNLLAVSRHGRRSAARLRTMPLRVGDVLLLQGHPAVLEDFAADFGCVPLAERRLRIPDGRRAVISGLIMAAAIVATALGLAPAMISFSAAVLCAMATGAAPPRGVYRAIDWPVIVLLGALIPVAGAFATTGTADLVAGLLLDTAALGHTVIALVLILVVTMTLSDFMNNAATAAVMCPVAVGAAEQLGVNSDSFLMAVAIGSSCAFLTPIGHQNNTLILGHSGFTFGDYWRLGLPLEVIVVVVAVPLLLLVWPL